MRYVICAPPYTQKSAGIFVLYELQKWLARFNQDAIVVNSFSPEMIEDDDIVVYPEIIKGNPLNAKRVVRYILNVPGKLGGDQEYEKDEILVAFDGTLAQYSNGNVLRIPHIEEFFSNYGYERTIDCFWVGKGNNTNHPMLKNCIEITYHWPAKRRELAELLNRTRTLYTYDDRTAMISEAQLCGCCVKIIKDDQLIDPLPLGLLDSDALKKQIEQFIQLTQKDFKYSASETLESQIAEKLSSIAKANREQSLVSIIIPLYNQLNYTKECIDSISRNTTGQYEIICIDNASNDGTAKWFNKIVQNNSNYKLICNEENLGFPAAVNQGIKAAKGDYILIANNDIVFTPGWLDRMIDLAISDINVGIVGPISNAISGFQLDRDAKYNNIGDMLKYAQRVRENNKGQTIDFPRVAFFCTLIKKEVIDKIGGLDERFSPGNYEDDDFCLRAQLAGYKTLIAKDVFIHHYGSKSFKVAGVDKYNERLLKNRNIFIDKWGADPDEIWLKGQSFNKRNVLFPLSQDPFIENFERAAIYMDEQEFSLASAALQKTIANFDTENDRRIKYSDLLNLAGNNALILNDLETAKKYFEEELTLVPDSSDACWGLGEIFFICEIYESAKIMFEWAVKNNPSNNNAVISLAKVNRLLGLNEDDTSLDNQPQDQESTDVPAADNSNSEYNKCFLEAYELFRTKQYEDALFKLNEAETYFKEQDPALQDPDAINLVDLNLLKAAIHLSSDDLNNARKSFEKALNLNPESSEACAGLGEVFLRMDMLNEAKTMFEWAIKYDPSDEEIKKKLSGINLELGLDVNDNSIEAEISKEDEVFNIFNEAYELFIQKQYAKSLTKLIQAENSLEEIEEAGKRNEFSLSIDNFKGFNYLALNKYEKAKVCFEKVLGINPNSSQALSGLGEILFFFGKNKDAKVMFELGVQNNPGNQFAVDGLKKVNRLLGLEEADNSLKM
jgi:GT2 family glycosyltransferase/Tfp pilus assembly protein PilF